MENIPRISNTIIYYENGQIHHDFNFLFNHGYGIGSPHRIQKSWYPNGNIKNIEIFIDGVYNGLFQSWYENGLLYGFNQAKNNFRHGLDIKIKY